MEWIDPLGLVGNRANRRAGDILQNMENAAKADGVNAHTYSRHGAQTTLPQQYTRATTGLTPDGAQLYKVDSTRFYSNVDHLDALQKANKAMNANGTDKEIVKMNRDIGEGYQKDSPCDTQVRSTDRALFIRRNGHIFTGYPKL
ncbi:hypothetical protein [Acinetobacter lanii]|uniref:hypothetical protein n=1 Tax=Acinetobacter lanii TaxID=2715163 RepID=UPI0018C89908|nr:hypothetical protein [Acinetobacter lanii]